MASSDSSAKMLTLSQTPNPTLDHLQGALDPGITIALLEIGSRPPFCWGSLPPLKNSSHPVTGPQTAQKFNNLLKDIKDILKSMASSEEKTTESNDSFENTDSSEDESELKEKIRGLHKTNKMLLRKLLISLGLEKGQYAKKQETILKNQISKNTEQVSETAMVNHSEEKRALNKTQLSQDKGKYGSLQEENMKLRNNMEQLLQEAENWSEQHTELSELIKSYQNFQKDRRETFENNQVYFQTQPNSKVSVQHELEEEVRKLNYDTYSLHLIAALLENECQILQQRVEILKELHHHQEETRQEKPIQINCEQAKICQKPTEAEKVATNMRNMQEMEGTFHRKDKAYRSSDACLNKKARKNRFNARIARRSRVGRRRPTSSLR